MTAVVELRGIGKTFPGVRALHDVSLAIEPGEVLGLVGENGAGKSTLIKILGGVYPAGTFRGEVVVGGTVRAFHSTRDARRAGIAVVHQELSLVPAMSIADNLLLGREPARFGVVDAALTELRATELVRGMLGDAAAAQELSDLRTPVERLGIAKQQVLEIARALADSARVVVLDEPTAALAEAESERLFALLRARRDAGTSFVYISHRLDEIAALCDRVAVLRDGELVAVRDAKTTPQSELVALMTGKAQADVHARRARGARSTQPVVLAVRSLSVAHPTLPGRRAVDELSFELRAGEIVALAGAMGAGRSATLAALFGAARTEVTGAISMTDAPYTPRSPAVAIAAGFAYVPEDRKAAGLVLDLSVGDNLALAALPHAVIDPAQLEHAAAARVRELAIKAPSLAAAAATLSGGNQQKIVIGKWLALAPRVLLLDEPTRGVDVGAKAELYALIEQLAAAGHAILLASSDLPEICRLADRVLVLREGRLAGELAGDAVDELAIMQLAVGAHAPAAPAAVLEGARA